MTTPSFSVSRMDPICWSHCGFSLLNTLSFCRTAAIEKTYARNSRRALCCFRHRRTNSRGEGKCIASTKARRASETAELIDLLRDNKPKECSLDHAASVALPHLR